MRCLFDIARCHGLGGSTFQTFDALPAFTRHLQLLLLRLPIVEAERRALLAAFVERAFVACLRLRGTTIRWRVSWPHWPLPAFTRHLQLLLLRLPIVEAER